MASTKKTEPMPIHQYQVDYSEALRDNSMSPLFIVRTLRSYSKIAKYYTALCILSTRLPTLFVVWCVASREQRSLTPKFTTFPNNF